MRRSVGKRIRIDDPLPEEYDTLLRDTSSSPTFFANNSTGIQNNTVVEAGYVDNHEESHMQNSGQDIIQDVNNVNTSSESVEQVGNETPVETEPESNVRVTRARLRKETGGPPPPVYTEYEPTPPSHGRSKRQPAEERPKRQPRAPKKPNNNIELFILEENGDLYTLLCSGKTSLQMIVDDWIEQYKTNETTALISLMQFFISASGCKGRITEQMSATMEHAAIIRKMTEEFDEESGEYPLIMSGQQWKKFRQTFCDFVAHLIKQCQYSIVYDHTLMDNIIALLTGLSDSQVRAFRHTATLAGMKFMTALVDVALTVSVNLSATQRQYEAERQKTRDKRSTECMEALLAKRSELEENMDEIKNMLTYLFKSIFVHRYRDSLPEIRSICMAEIGVWMKKFHQNFLDDSYLKYIGWTLHDKVGEVRLKCLQALQPLYVSEELKSKLELFTSKFKDRIVQMTLDKEYEVAVQAVRLIINIHKNHKDLLTDKDCEHIYELVYSVHRGVAQAAGEFLNERLFVAENESYVTRTKRGKKRLPNTPLIRDLVQFFIESELHEHGAYLVDSLIESNEMMKDWECMTDLLLEDAGPTEEPLDDRQETSLIELMACSVKQAATGEAPIGRGANRKITSAKEIKLVQEDKLKLSEHFAKVLPLLLDKYRADVDKLVNLVVIPQYFDNNVFSSNRFEQCLELLMKKLQLIVDKHHNSDLLQACSKTLEILCSEDTNVRYAKCEVVRGTIVDSLVTKYREAIDDWNNLLDGGETPNDDEIFNLEVSLRKMNVFYSCHNLGNWGVWLSIFRDLRLAIYENKHFPIDAIRSSIGACFYGIQWDLHHLEDLADNGNGEGIKHLVIEVKSRLHQFIETLWRILEDNTNKDMILKEDAYVTICDLLLIFCNQLKESPYPHIGDLAYDPKKQLLELLNDFVQTYVFVYEEEEENDDHSRIEALHKRRNFLASYCKLVVYSVLPLNAGADVFKHYVKSYNEYGDIIKATLGKTREVNKVSCARAMVASLVSLFGEIQKYSDVRAARSSDEFASLRELAKRFALSFGLDSLKNREAVTELHKEGILYAASRQSEDALSPPQNIAFLEVLSEFTNKLIKQDKRVVLNYLDKRILCGMPSSRGEDWQPLLIYRNSLFHGESDQPVTAPRRAYTRKKKDVAEEDSGSDNDYAGDRMEDPQTDENSITEIRPRLKILTIRHGRIVKPCNDDDVLLSQEDDYESDDGLTLPRSNPGSRPQRQCTSRSVPYKFVEQYSDEEY